MLGDVPWQACDLGREELERAPSLRDQLALGVGKAGHLLGDARRIPPVGEPRQSLELRLRQPERLADIADRAARAIGGEAGDQGGVLVAVPLRDGDDQLLPDVPRKIEIDVRDRGQLVIEKAPEREVVRDRIDMREAREVADDRADGASTATPGRQEAPGRVAPAHLQGALPRDLEHLPVEQEEAGELELVDQRQLALEPGTGLCPQRVVTRWVPVDEGVVADLRELPDRRLGTVGEVGIAVAELRREIELEALRDLGGAGDGCGVDAGEAVGDVGRGEQDALAVAAALLLRAVERGTAADRNERVLQQRAAWSVGVDVAGGDRGHPELLGEVAESDVPAHVAAGEGPLELDEEALAAECLREVRRFVRPVDGEAVTRTAREADQAARVLLDERLAHGGGERLAILPAHLRVPACASVRMRHRFV